MCLAVPMRVVSINGDMAEAEHGGVRINASLMIIDEAPRVGDYVIVHAGFAIHRVDPDAAAESLEWLHRLASARPEPEGA
jgi:hydrogenase expression/formation protein HypC